MKEDPYLKSLRKAVTSKRGSKQRLEANYDISRWIVDNNRRLARIKHNQHIIFNKLVELTTSKMKRRLHPEGLFPFSYIYIFVFFLQHKNTLF